MDKQIKELRNDIFLHCSAGLFEDEAEAIARFVITKLGYRKQGEVAREIFEEIEEALFNNHCLDDGTDFPTPHYFEELKDDIAELKKKYKGETDFGLGCGTDESS